MAGVGAGAFTGGVGGGVALGRMAGVSGGVFYDGTVTLIKSDLRDKNCPCRVFCRLVRLKSHIKKRWSWCNYFSGKLWVRNGWRFCCWGRLNNRSFARAKGVPA